MASNLFSSVEESRKRRGKVAEAMMSAGMESGPILHPLQGVDRLVKALMGGYLQHSADTRAGEDYKKLGAEILGHPALAGKTPAAPPAEPPPDVSRETPPSGRSPVAAAMVPQYTAPGLPSDDMGEVPSGKPPGMTGLIPPPPPNIPPTMTPRRAVAPAGDMGQNANAISGIESGGRYDAVGPPANAKGQRAYGKYQVMDFNIGPWTKEVLGAEMTPEQFLRSPEAQEKVFQTKFGQLSAKYGPQGAARAWFAGSPNAPDTNKDVLGTTVADYERKFTAGLPAGAVDRGGIPTKSAAATLPPATPPAGAERTTPGIPDEIAGYIKRLVGSGNPALMEAGMQMLAQYTAPDEYGFTAAGDTLFRTNKKRGTAEAVQGIKKAETPTTDARDYEQAVKGGYKGTFFDYQIDKRKAGKTDITIDQRGENAFAKKAGEEFAKDYAELQKGSVASRLKINTLTALGQNLANAGRTGFAAETMLEVNRAAKALGITDKDLGPAEAARAISNQLALQLRNPSGGAGMPGALSDRDLAFLQASVPGLQRTPEGNAKLIEFMIKIEQRSIDVARMAGDYVKRKGQMDGGFYDELAKFSAANPLFPEGAQPNAAPGAPPSTPGATPRRRYNPNTGKIE